MKRVTLNLIICLGFLSLFATSQAQTNQQLDEIRDLCTDLVVSTSQTSAGAHQVIVFTQNGNRNLERAVNTTGDGLEEVISQLGRLRRIANGTITNQRHTGLSVYRSSSSRLSNDWNENSRLPRAKSEVAGEIITVMDLIKNLSQEIRAEVTVMKNASN